MIAVPLQGIERKTTFADYISLHMLALTGIAQRRITAVDAVFQEPAK